MLEATKDKQNIAIGHAAVIIEFIRGLVRPVITFVFTGVISYLALVGKIKPDQLLPIYATVLGFYFASRGTKEGP
jgi:hypothetical protein|tara:strand:- start:4643 stop:4867 length:225 start_codon:yes stop_codon:yes gene_type:complete